MTRQDSRAAASAPSSGSVAWPVNAIVCPAVHFRLAEGVSITGVGAVLPAVMTKPCTDDAPKLSVALTAGNHVPALYDLDGLARVESSNAPSPSRSQAKLIAFPSGSVEAEASNWTSNGAGPLVGVAVATMLGSWLPDVYTSR